MLFFAAFLPRLAAIERYVTPDELVWVFRSVQFREAIIAGQWANTLTAGHPGVITTWLGALAVSGQLALRPSDLAAYQWITHLAWYAPENIPMLPRLYTFLNSARLLVILVNSLGVVAAFGLSRRLYGRMPALLIALLLAFDPFLVGLSGLLHVDGLLTTFATLSLLALALSLSSATDRPTVWAAISGAMAGLAILSKTPALLLPPFAAFFILLSMFAKPENPISGRFKRMLGQGLSWIGSCALLVFVLFPALWREPLLVFQQVLGTFGEHAAEGVRPSYFLGQITHDPGPLFYPLTLSFRLSPIVFCGLILAIILIIHAIWRRPDQSPWLRLPTWIFLLWPVLFLTAVTQAAQKYDRYALPVVPALIIVAALGWTYLPVLQAKLSAAISALVGIQLLYLVWVMPYPLTAANPLLGGTAVARQLMEMDWGEGASAAAHWLATQPDAANSTAVAGIAPALASFFPGHVLPWTLENLPQAEYIITTLDSGDLQPEPPVSGALPVHTIQFNGNDWVVIFQSTPQTGTWPPEPLPQPVHFSDAVSVDAAQIAAVPTAVNVAVQWQLMQPVNQRYTVKLDMLDENNQRWTGLETPLLNDVFFYPEHWDMAEKPVVHYRLSMPPGLPPAEYHVALSLFDAATQAQLPLFAADGTFAGMSQPLGTVQTMLAPEVAALADFAPSISPDHEWLNGRLMLLIQEDFPPGPVVNGDNLVLDLYWKADGSLPPGLQVEVSLGDVNIQQPLSPFDTASWRSGEIMQSKMIIPLPVEMLGGEYELWLRPLAADGEPLGEAAPGGLVEVVPLPREFELPTAVSTPRNDRFGDQMALRGVELPAAPLAAGEDIGITLYWQVSEKPEQLISAFVHLLDTNGQIVAQSDQWPGGLPANLWASGQVITDQHTLTLPPTLSPGLYQIAVGLYYPATGQRLPAFADDGRAHSANQVVFPMEIK